MAQFTPQFLDEIRTRLSVSTVVGRRVKLIRRGREYVGLSPFSNEKTPSFTVNDDKGFYHCFSTGEHGDIFGFVMKTQNLTFPEAVERLAEEAGLEMPRASPEQQRELARSATLRDAVEAAAAHFEAALWAPQGRKALDYLKGRGLTDETIRRFRLGYAAGDLKPALKKKSIPEDVSLEARLLSPGKDGRDSFDFFRDRVMFPIFDARGRPVAFGGRIMGEGEPKYLNSPDTPLFHKGQIVYGLALAREAAMDKREIIVAEGYMDVIALAQAGFTNAVAPLGTALTETQIELLWRFAPEPILCFDGDKAGQRAALRAAERVLPLLKPGLSLRFAIMPAGKDPDDICRSDGAAAMQEVLSNAMPLVEILWQQLRATHPIDTPERRASLERAAQAKAEAISDGSVRYHYAAQFRTRLREVFAPPQTGRAPLRGGRDFRRNRDPRRNMPLPGLGPATRVDDPSRLMATLEEELVGAVVNHPEMFDEFCERIAHLHFLNRRLQELWGAMAEIFGNESLDRDTLIQELGRQGFSREVQSVTSAEFYRRQSAFRPAEPADAVAVAWNAAFDRYMDKAGGQADLAARLEQAILDGDLAEMERIKSLLEAREKSEI